MAVIGKWLVNEQKRRQISFRYIDTMKILIPSLLMKMDYITNMVALRLIQFKVIQQKCYNLPGRVRSSRQVFLFRFIDRSRSILQSCKLHLLFFFLLLLNNLILYLSNRYHLVGVQSLPLHILQLHSKLSMKLNYFCSF